MTLDWIPTILSVLLLFGVFAVASQVRELRSRLLDATHNDIEEDDDAESTVRQIGQQTERILESKRPLWVNSIEATLQSQSQTLLEALEGVKSNTNLETVTNSLEQIVKQQNETQFLLKATLARLAEIDLHFQKWEVERQKAKEPPAPQKILPTKSAFEIKTSAWENGLIALQNLMQNKAELEIQPLLTLLQQGYNTLVAEWDSFAKTNPQHWQENDFRKLDTALYFSPVFSPALKKSTDSKTLQEMQAAILFVQNQRKKEIEERGITRIEGIAGVTSQKAGEIENDPTPRPPIRPETPEKAYKYHHIEHGMGGYRYQGNVLRRTHAIFYSSFSIKV